ncbi:A/G-specific adenine glycosylase [Rhodothalassium salexigens]|uniref:A/G-specific adenine glycosylase n=1 Tax=Rhodothalassium salexigens TaxID=1086 RepID=UPI00191413EE|nr:A/G-specific adenine glycosylase [Rhodothalassium salexigens]MBK5911362.1 A/G-specific adenine glycosylase [Rhodothalassium salexigens]MBK5921878.1 A/G-specific adenine glycosylase [Rhodothalassium salexigens]
MPTPKSPPPSRSTSPPPAADPPASPRQGAALAGRLLDWYDRHARALPWRAPPGVRPDPYHVWLSEVMLQQTTVATVGRYFARFLKRWPTVAALAAAERDAVLAEWAGLGYYARARNLHACAQAVVRDHGGRFPDTEAGLKALPGIGDYTAAAIAAIAFDRPATILDGNVERVIARLHRVDAPLPGAKRALKELAARITPQDRPGDYAQAIMDLGATVCTPTRPQCLLCPWRPECAAHAAGDMGRYPVKAPKRPKPVRRALAFWIEAEGAVLLRRRPDRGLLGGMLEIPSSAWVEAGRATLTKPGEDPDWRADAPELIAQAPVAPTPGASGASGVSFVLLPDRVRHTFTHFHLELAVARLALDRRPAVDDALWWPLDTLGQAGLPTVMRKVAAHAGHPAPAAQQSPGG